MSRFQDLPPEIIGWVFTSFNNIDDALHLARCCKYFYDIFNPTSMRLNVFRAIISQGPQHQYDIQLSQAVAMHAAFSSEFYTSPAIPSNSEGRTRHANMLAPLEPGSEIPEGMVWDVVCRWHGMRFLFDLYCDKSTSEAYIDSIFSYVGNSDSTVISATEPDLPDLSHKPNDFVKRSTRELRIAAYERFYKALTAQWASVERLWQVRSQVWPNAEQFDKNFESTVNSWSVNPARPLREKLDIVEVVDFIWAFLGRKAFEVPDVPAWLENEGDHVRQDYIDGRDTQIDNWGYFVRSILQFLRPPHVIQLVCWDPAEWNLDKPGFLRGLGLFDTWEGIITDHGDGPMSDSWVPLNIVDEDVANSLKLMMSLESAGRKWEKYRDERWSSEMRGALFFQESPEQRILNGIDSQEE
ncbi:hypothetical protein N7507_004277 [Penicillium longicatenatum]|nr:hypothetical protein N7507_004277 [Penicillium longicatenatum]